MIWVCAGLQEKADHLLVIRCRRGHERSSAIGIGPIHLRARFQEKTRRLGAEGSGTVQRTEDLAAIVDDLVATVPHGRVLELRGNHACHLQNMDRFLEELARHIAGVAV